MTVDRTVSAAKPERKRRDVSGLAGPAPAPVPIIIEPAPADRVIEVVLIAAGEDGDRPL